MGPNPRPQNENNLKKKLKRFVGNLLDESVLSVEKRSLWCMCTLNY